MKRRVAGYGGDENGWCGVATTTTMAEWPTSTAPPPHHQHHRCQHANATSSVVVSAFITAAAAVTAALAFITRPGAGAFVPLSLRLGECSAKKKS